MVETQIIANLNGQLTPEIVSSLQLPAVLSVMLSLVGIAFLIILLAVFIGAICSSGKKTKSKEYRELMSDMYVVGMVKKIAKEDDIDLLQELKEFSKIEKKKNLSYESIDEVISDNLKEKIDVKYEKEIEKIEKSNKEIKK